MTEKEKTDHCEKAEYEGGMHEYLLYYTSFNFPNTPIEEEIKKFRESYKAICKYLGYPR